MGKVGRCSGEKIFRGGSGVSVGGSWFELVGDVCLGGSSVWFVGV